jgi:hypothetical protein
LLVVLFAAADNQQIAKIQVGNVRRNCSLLHRMGEMKAKCLAVSAAILALSAFAYSAVSLAKPALIMRDIMAF